MTVSNSKKKVILIAGERKNRGFAELITILWVVAFTALASCQSPSTKEKTESKKGAPVSCERIVSMAPNITETVYALGLGDRLVGVTSFCKHPLEARSKQVIGDFMNPNYEILSSLKPDVVFLLEHHGLVGERLAKLGIRTHNLNSVTMDDLLGSIRSLGGLCKVEKRAQELSTSIEKKIKAIEQRTSHLQKPKVLISVGRSMGLESIKDIYVAGRGSLFDDVVRAAGGINAFQGDMVSYARMSPEGVLELNPDVIVDLVVEMEKKSIKEKDVVAQWKVVDKTNAVKNGRVHVLINDYVVIPGPRIILLVEDLANLFHPDIEWE